MSTCQQIITRALRRSGITRVGESPQARLSIEAIDVFNDMLYGFKQKGVDMKLAETRSADFTLSDEFYFWTPPFEVESSSVGKFAYQGTWDANANSPALTNATGTEGYVYRVSTAGSTSLNSITDWNQNDFLIFGNPRGFTGLTQANWYQSPRSRQYDTHVSALLAVRLSEELGHDLTESMVYNAKRGWNALYNAFAAPKEDKLFDTALVYQPTWARFSYGPDSV